MMKLFRCSCLLFTLAVAVATAADEFASLEREIAASRSWNRERLAAESARPDALILPSDRTPGDVVWRRTAALLKQLRAMPGAPDLSAEETELDALKSSASREGFGRLTALRRRIAFKNPLLDFDRIIFLKHPKIARGVNHMVDQYLGFNQARTGGVFVLEKAFTDQPVARCLLPELEDKGSFLSLDLDYDAKTILFAFTRAEFGVPPGASFAEQPATQKELGKSHYFWRPESVFHVYRANSDGSGLRQLTDGMWNDTDPCFLPSGRIAFISERDGGQCRCGARPLPSAVLHAMMGDGSDVARLSWHDTNEWQPSVDNNGMLVYTRWDYVDRDSDVAHHLWTCYPDGRDPRAPHGNYPDARELRPWMEMDIRAIPATQKYVAVAAPHHGQNYGSLVVIDLRASDDRRSAQLKRLTPSVALPESESAPGVPLDKGRVAKSASASYSTPWPLSEDFYLCVFDDGEKQHGIYLLDSFGNRELIYRDAGIGCLDPIPLKPRARPPVLPVKTRQAHADRNATADLATGTVAVMNAYESEFAWPKDTKIKSLRVVSLFPKDNFMVDAPNIGHAAQSLARGVLGTVPVEDDGSAYFKMPTGVGVYFQLLNEDGVAVQTMRSDTYLHPGEHLTCRGCHEKRARAAADDNRQPPKALQRAPSVLQPEPTGSYPLTFARLVQPVLDAKCLPCHDKSNTAPSLHGDRFGKNGWSESFITLRERAWGMSGGNGVALKQRQYSLPGQIGALESSLYKMITRGHHNVKLTPDQLRRVTLWLDCNSNFYGAYHDADKQARGEIVQPKRGVPAWMDFEKLVR
jgi:hypothetical protein